MNYNIFRKYQIYLLDHLQPIDVEKLALACVFFCRIYEGGRRLGLIFTRINQNFDQYNADVLKGL